MKSIKRVLEKKSATDIITESCKDANFDFDFDEPSTPGSNVLSFDNARVR